MQKALQICAATALGLSAISITTTAPAWAASSPYMAQLVAGQLNCNNGSCTASFFTVPVKHEFVMTSISCSLTISGGALIDTTATFEAANGTPMWIGLGLDWQRPNGADINYTLSKQASPFVTAGQQVGISIGYTGTLTAAYCDVFGSM